MSKKDTRKRILTANFTPNDIGKLPPQAVDLEEAVLGSCLLEKEAIEKVITILMAESFYKEQNGRIWNAIVSLYRRSEPADILTVTEELKRTGELELVGGAYYVTILTNRVAGSGNIEFHAHIVVQKFLAREIIRRNTETIGKAYDDNTDVFELFAEHQREMEETLSAVTKHDVKDLSHAFSDFVDHSLKVFENGGTSGVATTYRAPDKLTNGWQQTDLILVAGRPGMGKTAFALHMAYKPALELNIPTAFFSLEMSTMQLVSRMAASESEIDLEDVAKGRITKDQISAIVGDNGKFFKAPFYIDDTPALSLVEFKSKARKLVSKFGVRAIFIDYLQLMTSGLGIENRELEISTISRGLKTIAKELNIPIIALSQLSRKVEERAGKKPQLSDLRESGALEQDADMVIFTFRPEYYEEYRGQPHQPFHYEYDGCKFDTKSLFVGIVAKHRNGAVGEFMMGFIPSFAKMTNWDMGNDRPEWSQRQHSAPANLAVSKESDTFVQSTKQSEGEPVAKLETNTDFLAQKRESLDSEPPF